MRKAPIGTLVFVISARILVGLILRPTLFIGHDTAKPSSPLLHFYVELRLSRSYGKFDPLSPKRCGGLAEEPYLCVSGDPYLFVSRPGSAEIKTRVFFLGGYWTGEGFGRVWNGNPNYCWLWINGFLFHFFRLILPHCSLYKPYSKPINYEKIDNDGVSLSFGSLADCPSGRWLE